jgi:hypothetical protein
MQSSTFWDITQCSPLEVNWRLEKNIARSSVCYLFHVGFLLGLFFNPEYRGAMFLRNISWLSAFYTSLYPARYFFFQWFFQPIQDPGLLLSPVIIFTDSRTPWTSDQPIARPLPKRRTTQTQNECIHTPNIHALSWIRTHHPSVRASEDSSCLRPRGNCDIPQDTTLQYLSVACRNLKDSKQKDISSISVPNIEVRPKSLVQQAKSQYGAWHWLCEECATHWNESGRFLPRLRIPVFILNDVSWTVECLCLGVGGVGGFKVCPII